MAYQTGLLKATGRRKGHRPQERPKSFLAFGSRAAAEMGRLQWLCVLCSTVSARARAHSLSQLGRTEGEAAASILLCVGRRGGQ